jgi:hypothetical protein
LKLVFPHQVKPEDLTELDFDYFFLSPMNLADDPGRTKLNAELALRYCQDNPKWRLTLQYHKHLGLP